MATRALHGRLGKIQTAATSSGTAADFGAMRNFTLNISMEPIDATDVDSSGWQETLYGKRSWELTAELTWLTTAATSKQDELRVALSSETRQWFKILSSTGTAGQTFTGYGYVNGWSLVDSQDDAILHNFGVTGDGALTEA